jgi:hypothetical protein
MEGCNIAADCFDYAGGFVAHYKRRHTAAGAAIVAVHVATTDAAGMHANEQIVVAGRGPREVGDFEVIVG